MVERTDYAVQVGGASNGPSFPTLADAVSEAHRLADERAVAVTIWRLEIAQNGLDIAAATELRRVEPGELHG